MVVLKGNYRHSGREPGAETRGGMNGNVYMVSTHFDSFRSILRKVDVADINIWDFPRNFHFLHRFPTRMISPTAVRWVPLCLVSLRGVHHPRLHRLGKDHTGAAVHPGLAGGAGGGDQI